MQHLQEADRARRAVSQVRRLDLQPEAVPALLLLGRMLGRAQPRPEPQESGLHGACRAESALTPAKESAALVRTALDRGNQGETHAGTHSRRDEPARGATEAAGVERNRRKGQVSGP